MNCLFSYQAVSPRMVCVRVKTRTGVRNIVEVYAPDSSYHYENHQDFMDMLELKTSTVEKGEELQVQFNKWTTTILPGQKLLESLDWTVRMTEYNCCGVVF